MYSSLTWSHNGKVLFERQASYTQVNWPKDKGQLTLDDSLEIFSVQVEDSGDYTCMVIEGARTRNTTHKLIVEDFEYDLHTGSYAFKSNLDKTSKTNSFFPPTNHPSEFACK
ncbi:hypothetical protein HOLleu_35241 [Holothuria leucospilota]|uniref:Ig-like domain-containing protein n=1 Tax=Holothuria leucospilota TaxID=206669 RepID=A0A9Q0YMC0_HOLLE|nr:hypothetical protein HOLleu_35241 [Holothuria leucospilota]